jgi:hypothetical protein
MNFSMSLARVGPWSGAAGPALAVVYANLAVLAVITTIARKTAHTSAHTSARHEQTDTN